MPKIALFVVILIIQKWLAGASQCRRSSSVSSEGPCSVLHWNTYIWTTHIWNTYNYTHSAILFIIHLKAKCHCIFTWWHLFREGLTWGLVREREAYQAFLVGNLLVCFSLAEEWASWAGPLALRAWPVCDPMTASHLWRDRRSEYHNSQSKTYYTYYSLAHPVFSKPTHHEKPDAPNDIWKNF